MKLKPNPNWYTPNNPSAILIRWTNDGWEVIEYDPSSRKWAFPAMERYLIDKGGDWVKIVGLENAAPETKAD